MRIEDAVEVSRSPDEVFHYLADVRNEPRWNPWGERVEMMTPEPIGQGSRFRGSYKRIGTVEQELSIYEPGRRLTYASDTMGGSTMTFDLSPAGAGTRIHLVGEAHASGLMKLAQPLMGIMMRRHFRDLAEGLRQELGDSAAE